MHDLSYDNLDSIELLTYTSIEQLIKLIYALLVLTRKKENEEKTGKIANGKEIHGFIFGSLKMGSGKKSSHNIVDFYEDIISFDENASNYFLNVNISYKNNQPANNFFLIKFNDKEFLLNDSFSSRYPGYTKNGIKDDIPTIMDFFDIKYEFAHFLIKKCEFLLNDFISS